MAAAEENVWAQVRLGSGKNVRTEPNFFLGPKISSDKTKNIQKIAENCQKTLVVGIVGFTGAL